MKGPRDEPHIENGGHGKRCDDLQLQFIREGQESIGKGESGPVSIELSSMRCRDGL